MQKIALKMQKTENYLKSLIRKLLHALKNQNFFHSAIIYTYLIISLHKKGTYLSEDMFLFQLL